MSDLEPLLPSCLVLDGFNIVNYYTCSFPEPNLGKNILFGFGNGVEFQSQISELESPGSR